MFILTKNMATYFRETKTFGSIDYEKKREKEKKKEKENRRKEIYTTYI